MPDHVFENLPEDLRFRLCTPYLHLTSETADRQPVAYYAKLHDVIRFSSTLSSTERLIYCHYAWAIRRRSPDGCETQITPAEVRYQHRLSQPQMYAINQRLKLLRLMPRYLANGELTLWMPEQLTVGHIFLLQPYLVNWPKKLRQVLADVALSLPSQELFLPWLKQNLGPSENRCEPIGKPVIKHRISDARKLAQIAVSPLAFPPSISGHSFCDRDREGGNSPSARPPFSISEAPPEQDSAMPQTPLRDIDAPEDEPIKPSRPSLPSAVQDVFRRALEHKPRAEPVHDLVASRPDEMDEIPPETPQRHVEIKNGPLRPRWSVSYWVRYILLQADAHQVPLWCDEPGKSRTTRSMLVADLPLGAAGRRVVRQLLELMLVRLLGADAQNPHADLPTLQALAAVLKELFRDWNYFCTQFLKKPDGMPFHPAYLTKAFGAMQEWFLASNVATASLSIPQLAKIYHDRQAALEQRRTDRQQRAAEAHLESEYD